MDFEPDPVAPFESVAVAVIVLLPLTGYVVSKLAPVPMDGLPLGADQEKVNVPVPPLAVTVQVTVLPTVAEPQDTVTVIATGLTVTSRVIVAEAALESVAVNATWKVVVAVTEYVCVVGDPVPVVESPKSHANV